MTGTALLAGAGVLAPSGLGDQRFGQYARAPRVLGDIRIEPFFGCRHEKTAIGRLFGLDFRRRLDAGSQRRGR